MRTLLKNILPVLLGLSLTLGQGAGAEASRDDDEQMSARDHIEDGAEGHDEAGHEDHDEEEEERAVRLSPAEIEEFGIGLEPAAAGIIMQPIQLAGEIVVDPDRFAHVVPRVDGVVRQVLKGLGDQVAAGDIMAIIDSREWADLKSAYLAAMEREALTRSSYEREERLWRETISSERDYLEARQAHAEAVIEMRSARHKLLAIGLEEDDIQSLPDEADAVFSRFQIRAPFDGVVIDQHIALGESVAVDTEIYSVADLSEVWALLTVYQRELSSIREGSSVTVRDRESRTNGSADSHISYVSPVIDEATRTASARVVLQNPSGVWRPGMFVRGEVVVRGVAASIVVSPSAVHRLEDEEVVFVYDGHEFQARNVSAGRTSPGSVEILDGLQVGEVVASQGAFTLKAQLEKGELADED